MRGILYSLVLLSIAIGVVLYVRWSPPEDAVAVSPGKDSQTGPEDSDDWGTFSGNVVAEWITPDRKMKLREDFSYTDPRNKVWLAPKDWEVDGASIPPMFWSVIGGPFSGEFRNASVVHDVYCDQMSVPADDVHKMFYEACRCGGVGETKAKLMFWAVDNFGPDWNFQKETRTKTVTKMVEVDGQFREVAEEVIYTVKIPVIKAPARPEIDYAAAIDKVRRHIDENDPSLDELQDYWPELE